MELTDKEKSFLNRIARQKNLYLTFSIISVAIALILFVYHGLVMKNMSAMKMALIIIILLAGRAHLRQYRSAGLLCKFKLWLERKEV